MKIENGSVLELKINSITDDGMGVAKFEMSGRDFVIFVIDAITGDVVKAKIVKKKKNHAIAKVIKLVKPSDLSVDPFDRYFGISGGCSISRMQYEHQLIEKQRIVRDCIQRIGGFDVQNIGIEQIDGMEEPFYYRNKAIYPCGINARGEVDFGYYKPRSHDIAFEHSSIIENVYNAQILDLIKLWANKYKLTAYDENTHVGIIRTVIIRNSQAHKYMIAIGANADVLPFADELVEILTNHRIESIGEQKICDIEIVSIMHNIQKHRGNALISEHSICLYGVGSIIDTIGDLKFNLALGSFFQINAVQTLKLYNKVLEFADLKGNENVWDIYCGAGTISLYLARYCRFVRGNEYVEVAVENAFENSKLNGILNVDFEAGAAEDVIPTWLDKYETPNVVVLDPPRKGADAKVLDAILKTGVQKIVYVSCNPATLARDLKILCKDNVYQVVKLRPYDLFPHTMHVETVALLSKLDVDKHISVKIELDELDLTSAESKATYEQIKEYVLNKFGFKVSTLYIAQTKRKFGIEVKEHYNKSKKENQRVPQCTPEKEEAIMDALRHFKMI